MNIAKARVKYGKLKIALKEGKPLAVIRPQNPAFAIALAEIALKKQDTTLFANLPEEIGHYTFVGWVATYKANVLQGYIIDKDGWIIDKLQPGDSFVTLNDRSN